jgi:hypothetical protein
MLGAIIDSVDIYIMSLILHIVKPGNISTGVSNMGIRKPKAPIIAFATENGFERVLAKIDAEVLKKGTSRSDVIRDIFYNNYGIQRYTECWTRNRTDKAKQHLGME